MHFFFLHFVVSTHGELGGGGDGGALGGQSRHTCPCGRQSCSHARKSLKLMPRGSTVSDFANSDFSLSAQSSEGSRLRYESSMASSSLSLMVPDVSASAIWKSVYTHFLNSSDQTSPSNEVHGADGLGGGGDGGGSEGGGSAQTAACSGSR